MSRWNINATVTAPIVHGACRWLRTTVRHGLSNGLNRFHLIRDLRLAMRLALEGDTGWEFFNNAAQRLGQTFHRDSDLDQATQTAITSRFTYPIDAGFDQHLDQF
jgi:hypothetical protein